MACAEFPTSGLMPNVTTHVVDNVTYRWDGTVWEAITSPFDSSQISHDSNGTVKDTLDRNSEYLSLKIFQSPTDGGLTEIQTRTVDAGEVYEVHKTSDGSLATIYSDAAGTTEIVQNGTSNKSGSDGVVEFFVGDGEYYVEVGGTSGKFEVGYNIVFSDVNEMIYSNFKHVIGSKIRTNAFNLNKQQGMSATRNVGYGGAEYVVVSKATADSENVSYWESGELEGNYAFLSGDTVLILSDVTNIDVTQWGALAKEDFNNTPVFVSIAGYVRGNGGNASIYIPPNESEYIYEQYKGSAESYWGGLDIFDLSNCNNVVFDGGNAKIKLADGTRFGSFDPITGEPMSTIQTQYKYANGGGRFLRVGDSDSVTVKNVRWDGNVSNHVIGGQFGDMGYQIGEYGLLIDRTMSNLHVFDCDFSHSGLDGFAVAINNPSDLDNPNINIVNIKSEYNGRQGLSFTGGSNINFLNCSFSKTGRDTLYSSPGAGIDIEPEGGRIVAGNKFFNCHMHDCVGAGLLTAVSSANMYDNDFIDCSFIGTSQTPLYLTSSVGKVSARFTRCHIKGAVAIVGNGQFFNCKFDDEPTTEYPTIFTSTYFFQNGTDLSIQDGCTYKITQANMPLFYFTKGIRNAKVYPAWNTDTGANSILGYIGGAYTWGNIEIYDRLTGSAQVPVYNEAAVLGEGAVTVAENNGLIRDAQYKRDSCPDYRVAAVKPLVTGLLITAQENSQIERQYGPMQITVQLGEPTSGNYQDGDIVFRAAMSPGGTAGFACTTGGVAGSTAVFKQFGQIEV